MLHHYEGFAHREANIADFPRLEISDPTIAPALSKKNFLPWLLPGAAEPVQNKVADYGVWKMLSSNHEYNENCLKGFYAYPTKVADQLDGNGNAVGPIYGAMMYTREEGIDDIGLGNPNTWVLPGGGEPADLALPNGAAAARDAATLVGFRDGIQARRFMINQGS